MSHRTPSKTDFSDDWREEAACLVAVKEEPGLATAWDNVDNGTWEKDNYEPDPQAAVAKQICYACPVRYLCIQDALSDNAATGIRGGFRFEDGYLSKEDARKLYGEFRLRARVRKTSRYSGPFEEENQEMSEVPANG